MRRVRLPLLALPTLMLTACAAVAEQTPPKTFAGLEVRSSSPRRKDKVVRTGAEWRMRLTPEEYRILREEGTERACSGALLNVHEKGIWDCAGCDLPLFSTDAKFDSGSGWPSFFKPLTREAVWVKFDGSFGMSRYAVLCARCDSHLGHVFDDGPTDKTGLRYCINSLALRFRKGAKA